MSDESKGIRGTCEVHYYAKNDGKERDVFYCSVCDAWMCNDCLDNWGLRALAAVNKKKEQLKRKLFNA